MGQQKLDSGQDVVYMVGESPDTLDKPHFNFSNVSYTQNSESMELQREIQQKNNELTAALDAEDIEDLVDRLEGLEKERSDPTKTEREYKILSARIKRLEQRIETWEEPDVDRLRAELKALMHKQEGNILAGVVYLPTGWLIDGAPLASEIDWSDYTSLRWLRGDKFKALAKAKGEALNPH
jgi:hypothetical protein